MGALAGQRLAAPAFIRSFGGHGDPRAHLNPDGTRPEGEDAEDYHDPDPIDHMPKLNLVKERGHTWVVSGDPPKSYTQLWEDISQDNVPYWHRSRLIIWGNYKLSMKPSTCSSTSQRSSCLACASRCSPPSMPPRRLLRVP